MTQAKPRRYIDEEVVGRGRGRAGAAGRQFVRLRARVLLSAGPLLSGGPLLSAAVLLPGGPLLPAAVLSHPLLPGPVLLPAAVLPCACALLSWAVRLKV